LANRRHLSLTALSAELRVSRVAMCARSATTRRRPAKNGRVDHNRRRKLASRRHPKRGRRAINPCQDSSCEEREGRLIVLDVVSDTGRATDSSERKVIGFTSITFQIASGRRCTASGLQVNHARFPVAGLSRIDDDTDPTLRSRRVFSPYGFASVPLSRDRRPVTSTPRTRDPLSACRQVCFRPGATLDHLEPSPRARPGRWSP